jgi:hypothetical protein
MARYCLRLDVLEYFLPLRAEAGLNVAALAGLARMQWLIALGAVRNAGILETVAAARCTDAGCIRVKS